MKIFYSPYLVENIK